MTINLSDGPDKYTGTAGSDTIRGNGGDDFIDGAAGNDSIAGGAGNDRLRGSTGDDFMNGDTGNDALNGGDGNDTVLGGFTHDNDTLNGGNGSDLLRGGPGNDLFLFYKGEISNGGGGRLDQVADFLGAGGWAAHQDVIRFVGFGAGSTFTFTRDTTALENFPNGAVYTLWDSYDNTSVELIVQFADNAFTGPRQLRGAANGVAINNADYGWG